MGRVNVAAVWRRHHRGVTALTALHALLGEHPAMSSLKTLLLAALLAFAALNGAGAAEAVNINRATADRLQDLPGIGARKAAAIVQYRETHGAFDSVDQLIHVNGIGVKLLAKLRDQVAVE